MEKCPQFWFSQLKQDVNWQMGIFVVITLTAARQANNCFCNTEEDDFESLEKQIEKWSAFLKNESASVFLNNRFIDLIKDEQISSQRAREASQTKGCEQLLDQICENSDASAQGQEQEWESSAEANGDEDYSELLRIIDNFPNELEMIQILAAILESGYSRENNFEEDIFEEEEDVYEQDAYEQDAYQQDAYEQDVFDFQQDMGFNQSYENFQNPVTEEL